MTQETLDMLRVMPREMRMMTERVLSLTSLPKGFVLAETDLVMYSQKLDLGGFGMLEQRFETLCNADPSGLAILSQTDNATHVDAGGQHAWVAIPTVLDLLAELCASTERASITVTNCLDPAELKVAAALGARRGLAVELADDPKPALTATCFTATGRVRNDEPLLWDLLENGADIEAALWWRIFHLAQKALTPDSVISRRHAGPLIVSDDGTVIGRKDNDDETDISFLASPAGEFAKEGAKS